jgi:hypothetical protein
VRRLRALYERSGLQQALPHAAKVALRRRWLAVAREVGYPVSSPRLPRPPLRHDRTPMRLGRVLMACDLNPDYLDYWPAARRAWLEIVGVEPMLILIAEADRVPGELADDELVLQFAPLPGVHTALQAQCIRLLYPAVVDTEDAVLISDVDLYPLRASYFLEPVKLLDRDFFVSYRDECLPRGQLAMAFNAARPSTWAELFGVTGLDDVRARLAEWTADVEYDGRRAWPGWYRDQKILYETLKNWGDAPRRWWLLDDDYTRFRRLDKLELERENGLEPHRRQEIGGGSYSDYVCLFPYREHRETNDLVLRLALEAANGEPPR